MSTPEEQPNAEEALARARAARAEMAAALDEDQEPEPDEPVGWQPVWKRPLTPKSKADKKKELRKQRRRLQDAAKRRLAAGQSRRPRSRQSRIGNAAAPRCPRPVSGAALQRLVVVTMPGIVHRVEPTMFCIRWRCTTSGGLHSVDSTRWTPLSGAHRMTMDATPVRTTMSATAPGAHRPTMSGTHVRTRCAAPDVPHCTGARTAGPPLDQVSASARPS